MNMKKYSPEWQNLNKLLFHLGGSKSVPDLVDDYYLKGFGNSAPANLLRQAIKNCQNDLNNAENGWRDLKEDETPQVGDRIEIVNGVFAVWESGESTLQLFKNKRWQRKE